MSNEYKCPKYGETKLSTDRHFAGGDTGDRTCSNCGYSSYYTAFLNNDNNKKKEEKE
jgi:predicted nucleic-acid-binding Zn-ribbon protein